MPVYHRREECPSATFDTIIKNGMIVDGTRMPRFRGDVGIKDGVITRIGRLKSDDAAEVLNASGMIVAPGFIDLHTHYNAQVFWDPYCTISGWHGVTSAVIGDCGFGFAPVRPDQRERAMLTMTRVEAIPYVAMKTGMPWDWTSFPGISRQPRPQPQGNQHPALRADCADADLGDGPGGGQDAQSHRGRGGGAMPLAQRGAGRRRLWMVGATAATQFRREYATRLRRQSDGHRRHVG